MQPKPREKGSQRNTHPEWGNLPETGISSQLDIWEQLPVNQPGLKKGELEGGVLAERGLVAEHSALRGKDVDGMMQAAIQKEAGLVPSPLCPTQGTCMCPRRAKPGRSNLLT